MEIVNFGLVGVGGFAREVMPFVEKTVSDHLKGHAKQINIYFVDAHPKHTESNNRPVLSDEQFASLSGEKYFNIAIGDYKLREQIAARFIKFAKPLSLISSQTIQFEQNQLAEGMILCPFTTITSNSNIGRYFHANIYSYVGHDCVIGDFVTFAPRVNCNGNIHVQDYVYIGTGAIIKQGTPDAPIIIGEGAIIGMGAVVTKSVAAYQTVIGNPARPFLKDI